MSLLDLARQIQRRIPVPKIAAPHEAFCIGLDLAADFAALCVLERLTITTEEMPPRLTPFEPPAVVSTKTKVHRLRCLQRLPSGYPEVIQTVSTLIAALPEAQMNPALAVNVTRVGRPVAILMANAGLPVSAITVTAGEAEQRVARGEYRIPLKDLTSNLSVLLQNGRFLVAQDLPEASTLVAELGNFSAGGDDSWEAHNLFRSVCVASWWCEKMRPTPKIEFSMAR
jgi:hypothetical protein